VSELLAAAKDFPVLLAALITVGGILYAAERLFALSGPLSKLVNAWRGRELTRLRREALLRAERRRLQMEEESAVIANLRAEVADLSAEVARLRGAVREAEAHHRRVKDWADGLLRSTRTAGLVYADPPITGERPTVPA
jgi:hypothetical protein